MDSGKYLKGYHGRKFITRLISNGEVKVADNFISACHLLNSKGLTPQNAGNLSERIADGMLITPGGISLGDITLIDIVKVIAYDPTGNLITVVGQKEPSSESIMHFLIYQKFPSVNAIVHVHDSLVLKNSEKMREFKIALTQNEFPYGTPKLAREVIHALQNFPYAIIKNHGSLAVGRNLKEAVDLIFKIHEKALKVK